MLMVTFGSITVALTGLLAYYLWRVPEGPECPACGGRTRAAGPAEARSWLGLAQRARCSACAWEGVQRLGQASRFGSITRRRGERGAPEGSRA